MEIVGVALPIRIPPAWWRRSACPAAHVSKGPRELMREEGIERSCSALRPRVWRAWPEEFVRQLLVEPLGARAVLVGENLFGYRHSGNVRVLAELGRRLGFETEIVHRYLRGRVVSSSGFAPIRPDAFAGRAIPAARLRHRGTGGERARHRVETHRADAEPGHFRRSDSAPGV